MATLFRHRIILVAGTLALALAVSGCAGRVDEAAISSSPAPASTPAPEAIALTGAVKPDVIFGGDCSLLFSDDAMAEIAGAGTALHPPHDEDGNGEGDGTGALSRQLGITSCDWSRDNVNIRLHTYWDALDLGVPPQDCGLYTSGEPSMNTDLCQVDAESHGVRIGGVVIAPTKQESQQIAGKLLEQFKASDVSHSAGEAPDFPADAWNFRKLCEVIGPIELDGQSAEIFTDILGTDAGALPIEEAIDSFYPPSTCYVDADQPGPHFNFAFVPGAAWNFDASIGAHDRFNEQEDVQTSPDYVEVTVPGFSHGALQEEDGNRTYLLVSGSNFLTATIRGDTNDVTLLTAIRQRLDELAAG